MTRKIPKKEGRRKHSPPPRLARSEWDFSAFNDYEKTNELQWLELLTCWHWEYARESPSLRTLAEARSSKGPLLDSVDMTLLARMLSVMCPSFPSLPWQATPWDERWRIQRRGAGFRLRPLEQADTKEVADLWHHILANVNRLPRYSFRTDGQRLTACENHMGTDTVAFTIDWHSSTDKEIVTCFEAWVKERRETIGAPEPRGLQLGRPTRHKSRNAQQVRLSLWNLGVLRMFKAYNNDTAAMLRDFPDLPATWKNLNLNTDLPLRPGDDTAKFVDNARESVRRTFDSLLAPLRDTPRCFLRGPR